MLGRVVVSTSSACRAMCTQLATKPAAEVAATTPAPVVRVTKKGSSLFDRLGAFFVGVGVGGFAGYLKVSDDIWESSAEVEASIGTLKEDVAGVNSELRRRVSELEHQVANLKK